MPLYTTKKAISNIAYAIQSNIKTIQSGHIGPLEGKLGIALFLTYYSKFFKKNSASEDALELISSSIDEINSGLINPSFSSGITGLGWLISFLKNNNLLEYNDNVSDSTIEDYIATKLDESLNHFNYDFLYGGLGYVIYFIEKYREKINQDLISKIAFAYKKNSIALDEKKIAWETPILQEKDDVEINFGLAHGIPSILIIMAKLYSLANIENKVILKEILFKAANYLMAQKTFFSENSSYFPYSTTNKNYSRLAWCYGDLGAAYSIFKVGEILEERLFKQEALTILLASTKRKNLDCNMIVDAGICHGTTGIMQIYGNLYCETGLIEFKEASAFWFNQTLKMGNEKDYLGGFKFWNYNVQSKKLDWTSDLGMLTGIAGVGLSLLSYIDDYKFNWDKCLLLRL